MTVTSYENKNFVIDVAKIEDVLVLPGGGGG